jgi:ArsR family transcriptional regulator
MAPTRTKTADRSPLAKSEEDHYIAIFRALSEPLRLEMISLFDDEGSCPCVLLEERLPISKSTISYHIKILSEAGLIDVRKEGRFYHYDLREEVFEYFVPGLLGRVRKQSGGVAGAR